MIRRVFLQLVMLVALLLFLINSERQYRELQALQARQVYQKQVLLEEQSRLRLELQRLIRSAEHQDLPLNRETADE